MLTSASVFACYAKSCAPPPAGKGGSSKGGPNSAIARSKALLARTSPGRGAGLRGDDGSPNLPLRSIPNVSTQRLRRHEREMAQMLETREGMHKFDNTRRALVEAGMKLKAVRHELAMRDAQKVGTSSVSRKFLNENERVSTDQMGMVHGSDRMVTVGRAKAEKVNWDSVPVTTLPPGAKLVATEKDVATKYIKRVLDGEPLREGYEPQLVRVAPNTFMVYDGHHRMAMHSALGNPNEGLKVRIAEVPGMPKS